MSILHDLETREAQRKGTLRMLGAALGTAATQPKTWLSAYLLVTVPAVCLVLPNAQASVDLLAHHPGATERLDGALHADLDRALDLDHAVGGGAAALFVAVAFAWLAGGILACVGRQHGYRWADLFAEGGRHLPRNLRALLVGGLAALLVFWGFDVFDGALRGNWLYGADPSAALLDGRWLSLDMALEALDYLAGVLFLAIAYVTKLAMARLVLLERRGALGAWLRAALHALRHPLRTALVVIGLGALWLGASAAFGSLTAMALEDRSVAGEPMALGIGLLSGQLGILVTQVLVVATLLMARTSIASSLPGPDVEEADFSDYPPDYFEDDEDDEAP